MHEHQTLQAGVLAGEYAGLGASASGGGCVRRHSGGLSEIKRRVCISFITAGPSPNSRMRAHTLACASAPRTQRFLREQTFARTRAFDAATHARGLRLYAVVQLELEYAGSTR